MGDVERKRAVELVAGIVQSADDASIRELATLGADALSALAEAARSRDLDPPSRQALLNTLALMAQHDPALLLARMEAAGVYEAALVWALGFADPKLVTRPLIRLLRDPDDSVREAAARSLIRVHTPEAADALVPALDDRARGVQYVAVEALHDDDFFRLPAALPRLQRLVRDPHLKDEETEMVRHAREVLESMEH